MQSFVIGLLSSFELFSTLGNVFFLIRSFVMKDHSTVFLQYATSKNTKYTLLCASSVLMERIYSSFLCYNSTVEFKAHVGTLEGSIMSS